MADLDLDTLERLHGEATAGPWEAVRESVVMPDGSELPYSDSALIRCACRSIGGLEAYFLDADAALIAAARNALPALLAAARERDELRAEVAALRRFAREFGEDSRGQPLVPPSPEALLAWARTGGGR
jgi:hypothetical protein